MGQEGFSSDSSLLYHRHLPTAIVAAEPYQPRAWTRSPNHPLKPRHLRTHKLDVGGDAVLDRSYLLANDDCRISYVAADRPSPLYRNAIGDECLYVEEGNARLETVFGVLELTAGDYAIIPTSVIYRLIPVSSPVRLLIVEANGHIGPPKRYLSVRGQFLEHAPYCERDLRGPTEPLLVDGTDVEVYIQHRVRGGIAWTRQVFKHHPFDVVGWDGCLYPWAFSIHDFEPIRPGAPAAAGAPDLRGPNFVICSFVPRKVDYPQAIPGPLQPPQRGLDGVLFYTGGNYEARRGSGIGQGSISLHPGGFTHGPQPGAVERSLGVEYFDELRGDDRYVPSIELCEPAFAIEDEEYAWTWSRLS